MSESTRKAEAELASIRKDVDGLRASVATLMLMIEDVKRKPSSWWERILGL